MRKKITVGLLIASFFFISLNPSAYAAPPSVPAPGKHVNVELSAPDLEIFMTGPTSLILQWIDNSLNETGFQLERKSEHSEWEQIINLPPNTKKYHNTGLEPGTMYYYRIRAVRGSETSPYSNIAEGITNLKLTIVAPTSGEELIGGRTYEIKWETIGTLGECDGSLIVMLYSSCGSKKISYPFPNKRTGNYKWLVPNIQTENAKIVLEAFDSLIIGDESEVFAINLNGTNRPVRPTYLKANYDERLGISLNWIHSNSDVIFRVERKVDDGNFEEVYVSRYSHSGYLDTDVTAGSSYRYRVRASTLGADSDYSEEVVVRIPPESRRDLSGFQPAKPTDLEASAVSDSRIDLRWADNSHNESGFKIERKTDGETYEVIAAVGVDVTAFSDTGLSEETSCYYRVRAYNTDGHSDYSNEANAVTHPASAAGEPEEPAPGAGEPEEPVPGAGEPEEPVPGASEPEEPVPGAGEPGEPVPGASEPGEPVPGASEPEPAPPVATDKTVIKLYINNSTYFINGESFQMDTNPIIRESRTFLPIRFIVEPLGARIGWDGVEKKVTITLGGKHIDLWIGNNTAKVGEAFTLIDSSNPNVKPFIFPPGRTMLPIRFITEQLGCKVDWDPETQEVTITYPGH